MTSVVETLSVPLNDMEMGKAQQQREEETEGSPRTYLQEYDLSAWYTDSEEDEDSTLHTRDDQEAASSIFSKEADDDEDSYRPEKLETCSSKSSKKEPPSSKKTKYLGRRHARI
jgi:hypothetical protein